MLQETSATLAEGVAERVARRGRVCLRVQGVSMLPWVRPRDVVMVCGAQPEEARYGDLVLFTRHGRLYVHRVIGKREFAQNLHLLAKGDAHSQPDGPIRREELLGRVVRIHRGKRCMDLDTPWQSFKASLIAYVSGHSRSSYPVVRLATIILLPLRRSVAALRAALAVSH